jgi:hypothetical protein
MLIIWRVAGKACGGGSVCFCRMRMKKEEYINAQIRNIHIRA